jgi:hypothetical protein
LNASVISLRQLPFISVASDTGSGSEKADMETLFDGIGFILFFQLSNEPCDALIQQNQGIWLHHPVAARLNRQNG